MANQQVQLKNSDGNIFPNPYWPIGSIYISVNSTNPSAYFGGTWQEIQGKFLLGRSSSYPAGSTGGEASHKLITSEMPSHAHSATSAGTHGHNIYFRRMTGPTAVSSGGWFAIGSSANNNGETGAVLGAGAHTHTIGSAGGNAAHNNMPPYLAVYVWQRIK